MLASYAQLSSKSLGRTHIEPECPFRACFYRDLGRIVHSTAFRLLEYKTQVFVNHEGDYYRTRLTHSLEVSQLAAGIARILGANEDLAKTIALAHDLGHSPFGHPGEEMLDQLMKDEGGFEHNVQSYRVVTEIEECYPDFPGLNLSYEVLEGLVKHSTSYDEPKKVEGFKDVGHPTIEAQIVNLADEIAYMNHDLDDGIHWGMLSMRSLSEVELWHDAYQKIERSIPKASTRVKRCRTISHLITELITDVDNETNKRLKDRKIKTLDDVRKRGDELVSFSDAMKKRTAEVKTFLFNKVYRFPKVVETCEHSKKVIKELFNYYKNDLKRLPDKYQKRFKGKDGNRAIADYIAGMTDRFALSEHQKITT